MLDKWKIDQEENLIEIANYCAININVLESMSEWVRVVDKKGHILFMNKSMTRDNNIKALEYRCSFDEDIMTKNSSIPMSISLRTLITGETYTEDLNFLGRDYSVTASPIIDEMGQIFASVEVFRDVSEEMRIRKELYQANKRMKKDIRFAKTIQSQLLPKKKNINNLDIDFYYRPSEDLSGDMFDVTRIDDDRVGFYICDVVGHGVSASLLTMFIKQNISALISEGYGIYPSSLLNNLKSKFSELGLDPSVYATIFYGFYSRQNEEICFANAGHNCTPIIYKDGDFSYLEASGFPITDLFLNTDYEEEKISLKKGDTLYLYTDGISEIKNYRGEEFGRNGLIRALGKPGRPIENILRDMRDFSWTRQEDDIALLQIKVG